MEEFQLNFPLYSGIGSLAVGLDEGAVLETPAPWSNPAPVVIYGSSITQGGCASRPGSAFPAMLSRMLDRPFLNFGFSGSGKGEPEVIAAIAAVLEVCAFNFKPVTVALGWRADETRLFTAESINPDTLKGCTVEDGAVVLTAEEGSFELMGLGFELNTARALFESDGVVSVTAFFDSSREDKTVSLVSGAKNSYIDGSVSYVSIDLAGEAGGRIEGFTLIVNDYQFEFSWARFIAMIVVCCVTRALFGLQRPPDYELESEPGGAPAGGPPAGEEKKA